MKARIQITLFAILALLTFAPVASFAQKWKSDPVHSTVMYTVRHGLTPMVGMFKSFDVELEMDLEAMENTKVTATVEVGSVKMGIDKLEDHLKSPDFFDAEKFPQWSFVSTKVDRDENGGENSFIATGELTVRGVKKEVEIPFEVLGIMESNYGKTSGISAEFSIDRVEYGVGSEDTKFLGGDVKINVFLELKAKN